MSEQMQKPLVFFVRKKYDSSSSECLISEDKILTYLSAKYDIFPSFDLRDTTIDLVNRKQQERKIHALITHVPPIEDRDSIRDLHSMDLYYASLYKKSLDILWKIKTQEPLMPIIAYTGADHGRPDIDKSVLYALQQIGPINAVVFKSFAQNWMDDAKKLEEILFKPPINFAPMTMPWDK
jgi:hypothetical protein